MGHRREGGWLGGRAASEFASDKGRKPEGGRQGGRQGDSESQADQAGCRDAGRQGKRKGERLRANQQAIGDRVTEGGKTIGSGGDGEDGRRARGWAQ